MPVQAILGLPWLATFLSGLFTSVVLFLSQYLTRRVAITLSVIAAIGVLIAAFNVALTALINVVAVAIPEPVVIGASWFMPGNAKLIASTVITARVIRYVYEWKVKIVQFRLF